MVVIGATISFLLLLAMAGADYLVENISQDELSSMGIERKS